MTKVETCCDLQGSSQATADSINNVAATLRSARLIPSGLTCQGDEVMEKQECLAFRFYLVKY